MTAPGNEGTNNGNGTENNGTNSGTGNNNEHNTDFSHMERSDLEKALRAARDDAGKYRQKAKYAFDTEENFNRAKEAVTKLDEIEQAKKSEVEKLSEKNAQLLSNAAQNELALTRYRAAMNAGIDPSQVDEFANRLQGNNKEEIDADAKTLAAFFKPNGAKQGDRSQGQGNDGSDGVNPLEELFRGL